MADGIRTQIEEWAEEERRLGLHNTHGRMINESLEETLRKPVRAIRQQSNIQHVLGANVSSADTCRLMSDGMTDGF